METLEKLITLLTTLFTLSLISERIINWMKLYFGQTGKKLLFFTNTKEDITKRSNNPQLNTIRDRKILGLNIIVCVLVAFLVHANLFDFLKLENPTEHLGWNRFQLPKGSREWLYALFNTILGCVMSGLCMSMGSKFWHDALDLLFQIKKQREKLADK